MDSEMNFASNGKLKEQLTAEIDKKANMNSDPGDTGAKPIRNGVAKETSASVVGPMLPQTPLTGSVQKKGVTLEMDIPSTVVEFVYDVDSVYDEMVESAISGFANDMRINSLPFKLRKMTIERAVLRVKIAWCSKFKNKADKVKAYQKRYREVDGAINRIQKTVTNDVEKKKMAKAIDDIDREVSRKTKEKLNRKEIVESVNAVLTEMVNEGILPSDMTMIDVNLTVESEEILTEGANLDLFKKRLSNKKEFSKEIKAVKKALKKNDFDTATKHIRRAKENIKELREAIEDYPKDEVTTNVIGMLLGYLGYCLRTLIASFGLTLPAIGADAGVLTGHIATGFAFLGINMVASIGVLFYELYRIVNALNANLQEAKKNKTGVGIDILNGIYNKALTVVRKMEADLDKYSDEVKKAKKEAATKESVDEDPLTFYKEITAMYESGEISLDVYTDWYTEAKKPDDGIMDILATLNRKGYKTKYSCSGHKRSFKEDRDDNGVINGKLTSGARIMFKGDYEFPDPPKHWGWKNVDGKDYLYVLPKSHNADKIHADKAFDAWKNKYMASLKRWADSLPEQEGVVIQKKNPKKEADVAESAWAEIDAMIDADDFMESVSNDLDDEIALMLL